MKKKIKPVCKVRSIKNKIEFPTIQLLNISGFALCPKRFDQPNFSYFRFTRYIKKIFFFWGGGDGGVPPRKKIVINLPGTYEKHSVKANLGTNTQTDRQTSFYFVLQIVFLRCDTQYIVSFKLSIYKLLNCGKLFNFQ